jgi:ESS family glutamate:Na+ symporter
MLTGTASTGVALLREVDPNFKTPAATDLVTGSTTAVLFGLPILLIAGFAPTSITNAVISFVVLIALFLLFTTILLKTHK